MLEERKQIGTIGTHTLLPADRLLPGNQPKFMVRFESEFDLTKAGSGNQASSKKVRRLCMTETVNSSYLGDQKDLEIV